MDARSTRKLQCVAVCCSVLQCVAMSAFASSMCNLQCVAVCCRVLQRVAVSVIDSGKDARGCVQYVAVCCSVLPCQWYERA